MPQTKILIATPTYDGTVTVEYLLSIRSLENTLRKFNIESDIRLTSGSELTKARNAFVSLALNDPSITHLLFVDADMAFRPQAVVKLLEFGKPFSGCICPRKRFNPQDFHRVARSVDDPQLAWNIAQSYVGVTQLRLEKADDDKLKYAIRDGFVQTREIGCGITLLHKSVLQTMKDKIPDAVLQPGITNAYRDMGIEGEVLQVFETVRMANGIYLSEDLSFAWRWIEQCGGEIWACVDETIGHIGVFKFEGNPIDRLSRENPKLKR